MKPFSLCKHTAQSTDLSQNASFHKKRNKLLAFELLSLQEIFLDSPCGHDGEGRRESLSAVWCNNNDLDPETAASVLRSGHEQKESLRLCAPKFNLSSNSRVCLLTVMLEPVSLEWQVEPWVLEVAPTSETDTSGLPRRLLSFLVSRLIGLLEILLDCRAQSYMGNNHQRVWTEEINKKCA